MKDYYNILGVSKNATKEEIKKAYHKLAHQHHPHKGGDEKKMKEINEAYAVLGNDEKRRQYDQFGQTFEGAGFSGGQGSGGFSDFADAFRHASGGRGTSYEFNFGDLGDIFGDFFGGGTRTRTQTSRRTRGADIEARLTIDFREAVFGADKTVSLHKDIVCSRCKGNGAEPGSKISTCPTCQGTGQVVRNIGFGLGFPSACTECGGAGQRLEKKCKDCRGEGITGTTEQLTVKIPAGINSGQTIRLVGKGGAGHKGGSTGDLYVRVDVRPDLSFRREGYDLRTTKEISFTQAVLGDKVEVATVDGGGVKLKIPEGTPSGKIFRLRGRGVPHLHSRGRGDLLVKIQVQVPKNLSKKQKELLKDLDL